MRRAWRFGVSPIRPPPLRPCSDNGESEATPSPTSSLLKRPLSEKLAWVRFSNDVSRICRPEPLSEAFASEKASGLHILESSIENHTPMQFFVKVPRQKLTSGGGGRICFPLPISGLRVFRCRGHARPRRDSAARGCASLSLQAKAPRSMGLCICECGWEGRARLQFFVFVILGNYCRCERSFC